MNESMRVITKVEKPNTVDPKKGCVWVLGVIYVNEHGTRIRKNVFCGKKRMTHYHLCQEHHEKKLQQYEEEEDDESWRG